jgi:hypothetical protein
MIIDFLQMPGFNHGFRQFLDKQWDAIRLLHNLLEYFRWELLATRYVLSHSLNLMSR